MNIIEGMLPESVREHLKAAYDQGCELYEKACDQYLVFEEQLHVSIRNYLPDNVQPLARKIVDSFAETVVGLSYVTGFVGNLFAAPFWIFRAVQIITPFAKAMMNGQVDKDTIDAAAEESLNHLNNTIERLKPAMLVCCSIAGAAHAVSGFLTLNINDMIQGSIYAVAATMAYKTMDLNQAGGMPAAGAESSGTAGSNSSSSKVG